MNIRQVNFDCRNADSRNRVAHGETRVGIGRRVDDNPVIAAAGLLNPGHQFSFMIRLADIQSRPQLVAELRQSRIDGIELGRPIDGLLTASQKVEIGAMQDQHSQHVGYEPPPRTTRCTVPAGTNDGILAAQSKMVKRLNYLGS